jgi:hypothetical protein
MYFLLLLCVDNDYSNDNGDAFLRAVKQFKSINAQLQNLIMVS